MLKELSQIVPSIAYPRRTNEMNLVKKMCITAIFTFLRLCILVFFVVGNSRAAPSLDETIDYLRVHLGGNGMCGLPVGEDGVEQARGTFFEDFDEMTNELTLRTKTVFIRGNRQTAYEDAVTFPLSGLTASVKAFFVKQWNLPMISIQCSSPGCIRQQMIPGNEYCSSGSYEWIDSRNKCIPYERYSESKSISRMDFSCVSNPTKVAKALEHAIRLSGGKKELF